MLAIIILIFDVAHLFSTLLMITMNFLMVVIILLKINQDLNLQDLMQRMLYLRDLSCPCLMGTLTCPFSQI